MIYILFAASELCFFTKVAILRQIQRMKLVGCFVVLLFFLCACKKEEEEGTCFDGQLSTGEHDVDCGGMCPPCENNNGPFEIFLVTINGKAMQFSERSLVASPNWIMNFSNDTLNVTLNFGSGIEPGAHPIEQLYSEATMNGKFYDFLYSGLVVLSNIDTINNRLSGFFEAKLVGYFSDSLLVDTLKITNGDFESIPY
jgi:hypothetical protein